MPDWILEYAGICGFIWLFAQIIDRILLSLKEKIVEWWYQIKTHDWPTLVLEANGWIIFIFNRIYSESHWSLRCFKFSILFSYLGYYFVIVIQVFLIYDESFSITRLVGNAFVLTLIYATVYNLLADYISLVETRTILKFSKSLLEKVNQYKTKILKTLLTTIILLSLLVLDLYLTYKIFWWSVMVISVGGSMISVLISADTIALFDFNKNPIPVLTIYSALWTTFLTSLFFHLFLGFSMLLKFLPKRTTLRLLEKIEATKKPATLIASYFIALLTGVVVIVQFLRSI